MGEEIQKSELRWRVCHYILYLVNAGDETYYVYQVPLSDGGGSLIDLDYQVLPLDKISKSRRYNWKEVVEMAHLAGHSDEQIKAWFNKGSHFRVANA